MLNLVNNPLALAALRDALTRMGITGNEVRSDAAGDTLFLARELEFVSATSYDVLHDPIIGRTLVPFNMSVPEGAEVYSYDMFDGRAETEWITNWASLVGSAEAEKNRTSFRARSRGGSYSYTYQDLSTSVFTGQPIDRMRAKFARIAFEEFFDDLVAVGDSSRGIEGLTNHSLIPDVAPAVGTWDASTTRAELFRDLTKLAQAPEQATRGRLKADTLALPLSVKGLLGAPYSDFIPTPLIDVWRAEQSDIKRIEFWARLNTASTGNGPRALSYKMDPMVLEFMGSYDYRELPVQTSGYAFQVPTIARVVGLVLRYPLATARMDLDESP